MWAAEQGHTDVARLLLERGAVSMNKDEVLLTLCHYAVLLVLSLSRLCLLHF